MSTEREREESRDSLRVVDFVFPLGESVQEETPDDLRDVTTFQDMVTSGLDYPMGALCQPPASKLRQTLHVCAMFHRVLAAEGFIPLLIEVAAIRDRRTHLPPHVAGQQSVASSMQQDVFVSHYASYVDAVTGGSPCLLKAWHDSISAVVQQNLDDGKGHPLADIVPNVRTYEYLYSSVPFSDNAFARTLCVA